MYLRNNLFIFVLRIKNKMIIKLPIIEDNKIILNLFKLEKKIISKKEFIARICRARVNAVNCLLATLLWRKIEWQYFSATKFER